MLIFRYFSKEISRALLALTIIILLIFLSNQFVQYLSRAASGQLPGIVVLQLMALEIPNLLSLLLPLGFYVAILIAYGRMYVDHEMIALMAAGYGSARLYRTTLLISAFVVALVAFLVFAINPTIYHGRAKLIRDQGVATLIKTIAPEQFRSLSDGKQVFYVQKMKHNNTIAEDIFFAEQQTGEAHTSWRIIWAKEGRTHYQSSNNQTHVQLTKGHMYEGQAGKANYKVVHFNKVDAPLPTPEISVADDVRTLTVAQLLPFNNANLQYVAELQWRIAIPIMVLVLTLLAVPLSRVNMRQGKYGKLIPAILLYILYANFMFIGRDWLAHGTLPWWLGFWWLHGAMLLIAGILYIYQKR